VLVCVLCLELTLSVVANTLTLKNGQVLEGYFVRSNASGIIQDDTKEFMTMNDAKANDLAQRVMALDNQRTGLRNKVDSFVEGGVRQGW
jgi:hypothetical protein